MSGSPRFVVGIDLGTTHAVMAYAPHPSTGAGSVTQRVRVHSVRQWVAQGEIGSRPLLPTCLYATLPEEEAGDPWDDAPWAIGEWARRRGQEALGRLVVSAKSWLSYGAVDRVAPILPWGLDDEPSAERISPVEASVRVLRHLVRSWGGEFPDAPLAEQEIVLTVPASFNEVARELTLLAAHQAGLRVRLLEEPQAAFYDYLYQHGTEALGKLTGPGGETAVILVIDVGGGTTDLTLIEAQADAAGSLKLDRVAVGRHLLLGGDNMDLTLAHWCEPRLAPPPSRLNARCFGQVVLACREAKELLLGESPPEHATITVLGAGAELFSGVRSTAILRSEAERQVLEGFFPEVPRDAQPIHGRGGLLAFGLPYESDPAITRHVASFLRRHMTDARGPRALLLNGGVFRARGLAKRLQAVVASWNSDSVVLLQETDPELAVARGAVAYGLALAKHGTVIGGGAAHGYYLGLRDQNEAKVRLALCVVPRGAQEGECHLIASRPVLLTIGRPVRFDLYATDRAHHRGGEIVTLDEDAFDRLPPVAVNFGAAEAGQTESLPVVLEGELSAVGTLDLACVEAAADGRTPRRFRLAFDLRSPGGKPVPSSVAAARPNGTAPAARLTEARVAIERVFGKGRKDVAPREVKDLLRTLEKQLGERTDWTTELSRSLADVLITHAASRRRSPEHERVFWMLTGYCLRPGFGHLADGGRIQVLQPLFEIGLTFPQENRGWQQFFIAWRRLAGGLTQTAEEKIVDQLEPFLLVSGANRRCKGFKPLAPDELLELVSWLERLPNQRRAELGRQLVERTWTSRDPRLWAAIGRIGARIPAYASVHHVVLPKIVERWVDHLLREKWQEVPTAPRAALELARVTDDRARDLDQPLRLEVARRLEESGAPRQWVEAVRQFVPVREADRKERFGEDLPVGLELTN